MKVISQTGKVSGHVDMEACRELGITVLEGVGSPTAPAELTWALVMAARRKLFQYAGKLRDGQWQQVSISHQHNTLGLVLAGSTMAIWGYGKIGKLVAGYAKAFGMRVIVWGSEASRAAAVADGNEAAASREAFFAEADVLSLHLRLADATRGIVSADDLARMKRDALFVNVSRAELVAAGALEEALKAGHPGYAALDVFETEPLPENSPLLRMPNVLCTPHLGYVEKASYELYFRHAFQNLVNHING